MGQEKEKKRGAEQSREGTFKRLLILPGHCCCHQVGHVTELCILKRKREDNGGREGRVRNNSKHSGAEHRLPILFVHEF